MWENAFEKINEQYITESAELAPVGETDNLRAVPSPKSTGNLKFALAAAAAVIVSFIGVGFFFRGTGIEPLSPASSATDISLDGGKPSATEISGSGTMTTTIVTNNNGEIITVVSRSDEAVTTSTTPPETEKRPLTLADVIALSEKDDNLMWSDFEPFEGKEVGSGLYIMCYEINDEYSVMIGGVPAEKPMYVRLVRNYGAQNEEYIDLRTDDVLKFLNKAPAPADSNYTVKNKVLYISDEVTEIPEYMFTGATDFTQVSIPASVTKIGDYAFARSAVESVVFEGNVEICNYAFVDCINLKNVAFLNSVGRIGAHAFSDCSLGDISLPDNFTSLGNNAFSGNRNIKISYCGEIYDYSSLYSFEIAVYEQQTRNIASEYRIEASVLYIPEGTTKIEAHAFEGMDNFGEVVIPEGVTEIGEYAFANTKALRINLPDSLTKIGDYAFYSAYTLKEIEIPAKVKEIGYSAFDRCGGLEKVTLNSGLEKIGDRAFLCCGMLTEIEIPDTVKEIGVSAFENSGLLSVTIPSSVEKVDGAAFAMCVMLEEVIFEGSMDTIPDSCFSNCTALRSVTLPKGLSTINWYAFAYCTSLDIVLPDTVKFIGDGAFEGCTQFDGTLKPADFAPETTDVFSLICPVDKPVINESYGSYNNHIGIDYGGEMGQNVFAAADGTVLGVQWKDGYGNCIIIDHGNGYQTLYAHLEERYIKEGEKVTAGQTIAGMGNTGLATGVHLHFELLKDGVNLNPQDYIA